MARREMCRTPMSAAPTSSLRSLRGKGRPLMSERQVDLQGQGYLRDSAAIYERSFAIIRAEADLARFSADQAEIAIRMIHACGAVQVAEAIVFSEALVPAA